MNDDVRKVFFTAVRDITKGTPVDTGRARNNWQGTAKDLPKNVLGKKFILFNNMPYINKLEYGGHSQQAPKGWVRKAILKMRKRLRVL